VVDRPRVGQALDHVLGVGWSPRWIEDTAHRMRRQGVRGPNVLLDLLAERVGRRLPRSWFERLAAAALRRADLELEHEVPVRDQSGRIVASLDLAHRPSRVGVECQGWERHGSMTAAYADARRRRTVRRLGWEIIELWWWDLHRPDEVVSELLDLVARRMLGC
jgi:hypothetical protein